MSIAQSNITNMNLDLVVGVSQRALNGILKDYYHNAALYGNLWETEAYFIGPMQAQRDEVMDMTGNVDPLGVPAWNGTGAMPAAVQACVNARCFAFRFTPGDPSTTVFPEYDYSYVTFIKGGTNELTYTLVCSDFQVAYYDDDNGTWVNFTQSSANNSPKKNMVQFNVTIPLALNVVTYNPSDVTLPPAVSNQAKSLTAQNISFSFKNLVLDLKNAYPGQTSVLPFKTNATGMTYNQLTNAFLAAYTSQVDSIINPLTYTIQQGSTTNEMMVIPTSLEYYVNSFLDANGNIITTPSTDQFNLSTLNYFCSVNGDTPATAAQIPWNWLDNDNDAANYNGVMSLSKFTLAKLLDSQMRSYVENNCWVPQVSCAKVGNADQWSFNMVSNGPLSGSPFVTDNINKNLLKYSFGQSASAYGVVNTSNNIIIDTEYSVSVAITSPTSITIQQEMNVGYMANGNYSTAIISSYTDVYAIIVQANGTLDFQLGHTNNPPTIPTGDISFLTQTENEAFNSALQLATRYLGMTEFSPQPLGTSQQIFFPGGTEFTFKQAQFSNSNDLTLSFAYNNQV